MFLGYNTNGFAHHRLEDAIEILAELGYGGVALTLDVHHLNPFEPDLLGRVLAVRNQLRRHKMRCVVETGARFLLNPRRKHQPTLISRAAEDRAVRVDFLAKCVDIARELEADAVSFWSGTADDQAPHEELMERLVVGCQELAEHARDRRILLAFEPEPGMFVDTMQRFEELAYSVKREDVFRLTIDIGHLVCNGEVPASAFLREYGPESKNIHIEDMRAGVHDHIMFGEGEVDFADVFSGLQAAKYTGGVFVELSRHSHDAVNTARKAKAFLDRFL